MEQTFSYPLNVVLWEHKPPPGATEEEVQGWILDYEVLGLADASVKIGDFTVFNCKVRVVDHEEGNQQMIDDAIGQFVGRLRQVLEKE